MVSDRKLFVFKEVEPHNKRKDCWVIISGKVYDVSLFMDDHPGGDDILIASTGKDAAKDFEDVGHSDAAREMMLKYCIGEVDSSTVPTKRTYAAPPSSSGRYIPNKSSENSVMKIMQFVVPILMLGLAFIFRYYTKRE